ncbi:MAG: tRNA (adenosine(37)-N6)-dimethylallyltransferase MiaA [Deltaproteobacteria bacterium]|nr:tRNA (adenosine(37)-N6)-dimethylallyltransferase MiaA [Deltaproteobacteria bacterium]
MLLLAGPTASGKSDLALRAAEAAGGEIVNADAQQVYRHMDIGTAKPTPEERSRVPHHLHDVADPWEWYDAGRFQGDADRAIADIAARGRLPVVVGGTGLYLRALLRGIAVVPAVPQEVRARVLGTLDREGAPALHARLREVDPAAAARLHPNDAQRVGRALEVWIATGRPLSSFQDAHRFGDERYPHAAFGVAWEAEALDRRIAARVDRMFDAGFLDEARRLLDLGCPRELRAFKALGYREAFAVLDGVLPEPEARARVRTLHRRYAKRQRTWFRREALTWVPGDRPGEALDRLLAALP